MPVTFLGMAFIGVSWVWMGYEVFGAQYRWIDSSSVFASRDPVLFLSFLSSVQRPIPPFAACDYMGARKRSVLDATDE